MSTIVIDAAFRDNLLAVGSAELRDEEGKLVGRFVAGDAIPEHSGISYEEMERRFASNGPKYSTSEILEHLRKLA